MRQDTGPRLVMDSKAILEGDKPSLAAALGLIPRGLSSTEEVFDVVGYVNSTLSGTAQVMTSFSTKSGTTNETYGMTRLATTTESHTSYFVNDGRGSVVQTTNAQGVSTSWKSYSAFGEIEASSTLGELPAYGYNAEEQHPKTGLSFMRFRYYEAKTSTFGVQDTYLGNIFSPLTLNRYLYCLGNPVNYVDPTGHKGIGNILLNAANRVINPKKKHGGTQINNNSFADDPDQKTIYKPAWEAYDPSLTPDQRHQRSVANATLNEMLWHYELAMNSGNAAAIAYHLDCARKIQAEYEAFYCGDAEKIGVYIYNREAAINYAWAFTNDFHSRDTELDYILATLIPGYRNSVFPISYTSNCTNYTSQILFAGGIPMTKDWRMLPGLTPASIEFQTLLWSEYRRVYQLWDSTQEWTVASRQFEYFSDPKNGYINGNVINITKPNKPAINNSTEVPYSNLSSQLSSLNIQPGDLLYFYNEHGVHHSTVVSKVDDDMIYYTANTNNRFNESLETAVDGESGFLVVRINDIGMVKQ